MVQQIDFLPESYHHTRRHRQKKVWRRGVLAVFLAIIVAGTFGERQIRSQLTAERHKLQRQAHTMLAGLKDADVLRRRKQDLEAQANLATHLRVRVATTRVLAAVVGSLPEFVTLTELDAHYEKLPEADPDPPRGEPRPSAKGADQTDDRPPAAVDLEQLKQKRQQTALFVRLRGLAPDDVAVSNYLAALEGTGVFRESQLLHTDRSRFRERPLREFEIRLRTKRPVRSTGLRSEDIP